MASVVSAWRQQMELYSNLNAVSKCRVPTDHVCWLYWPSYGCWPEDWVGSRGHRGSATAACACEMHVTRVNSQTSRHALVHQCTPGMERLDNGYISISGACTATGVIRPWPLQKHFQAIFLDKNLLHCDTVMIGPKFYRAFIRAYR